MNEKAKKLGNEPVNHVDEIYFKKNCGKIGITKREYFAAMTMQGILADPEVTDMDKAAKLAIMACDALLEELSK